MKGTSIIICNIEFAGTSKEEMYSKTSKDKALIKSIIDYKKELEEQDIEIFAIKDNLLITEKGYYQSYYSKDLKLLE